MHVAREYNHPTPLLEATVSVNERQRLSVIKKLQDELKIIERSNDWTDGAFVQA